MICSTFANCYIQPSQEMLDEKRTAAANALVPGGFTGFADWAKINMKPT